MYSTECDGHVGNGCVGMDGAFWFLLLILLPVDLPQFVNVKYVKVSSGQKDKMLAGTDQQSPIWLNQCVIQSRGRRISLCSVSLVSVWMTNIHGLNSKHKLNNSNTSFPHNHITSSSWWSREVDISSQGLSHPSTLHRAPSSPILCAIHRAIQHRDTLSEATTPPSLAMWVCKRMRDRWWGMWKSISTRHSIWKTRHIWSRLWTSSENTLRPSSSVCRIYMNNHNN